LIGFTCLLHPCMVEKRSDGWWYHAPTLSAAQCVQDAVVRTRAPLEIWNNCELKDDVVAERQKLKTIAPSYPKSSTSITTVSVSVDAAKLSVTYEILKKTTLSPEDQEECARKLEHEGFSTLGLLQELTEQDLKDVGITRKAHVKALLDLVKRLNLENPQQSLIATEEKVSLFYYSQVGGK